MPFSFAARCGGDFRFAPSVAGTCGSPTHAPSLFCDTIQFAIETDRSCHRQGPGAEWRSGLFSLPQICAPVPADLNLPESVPQSGTPKLFTLLYSLFPRPAPAFPSHSPGRPENRPPQGRGISSPAAMRDCKTPFPPHSPACRAQAHSEPVPQSGTPKLFTLLYSLFTLPALPLFPSGTDSKTKIYFVFWSLDT